MKKIIFSNIQIAEEELKLILNVLIKLFKMKKKKTVLLKKKQNYLNLTQEY